MAEQLLNGPQIRAGIEQMRGECVAKRVRAQACALIDLREEFRHDELDGARAETSAVDAEKKRGAIDLRSEIARQFIALRFVVAERE